MTKLQQAVDKLATFATADALAAFLKSEGVKGMRKLSCSCPVAEWMKRQGFLDPDVCCGMIGDAGDAVVWPDAVRGFVEAFDAGLHPELDAQLVKGTT